MTEPHRRHFLTRPSVHLLLTVSAFDAEDRWTEWYKHTGLTGTATIASLMCAAPLPVYPQMPEGERYRFPSVPASMMWHPLFWLPPSSSSRLSVEYAEGEVVNEGLEEYAARLALELTFSGLYSSDEGWLDVLAHVGLNIADPAVQERVAQWQAGGSDPLLDAIDLSPLMDFGEDRLWAFKIVDSLFPRLLEAQDFHIASSLSLVLDEPEDTGNVVADLGIVASLALSFLDRAPGINGMDSRTFWEQVEAAVQDPRYLEQPEQFINGPLKSASIVLKGIASRNIASAKEVAQALAVPHAGGR